MSNCTVTVLCGNIYLSTGKALRGDQVMIPRDEAEAIAAGDEAAGRAPRISIAKRGRKSEAE